MKKILLFAMALSVSLITFSCSGDDGPAGPAGPTGPAGPAGVQGVVGNAGEKMYNYPSKTFSSNTSYSIPMSTADVEKCLVYAYYRPSDNNNFWYPVPGIGSAGTYEVRSYLNASAATSTRFQLSLYTLAGADYTTSVTFTAFRIIVVPIPEGNIEDIAANPNPINWSDYSAVAKHFNLPE